MGPTKLVYALDKDVTLKELEEIFFKCKGRVHSIKFNSMYHSLGNQVLTTLSRTYDIPLFYDLKLYDTPNTVYDTIKRLPKEVKYVTVAHANNNSTSLDYAAKASLETGKQLFVVSTLTSSDASPQYFRQNCLDTSIIVEELNQEYGINMGMVVPIAFIKFVKKRRITTLTPGLVVDENQLSVYRNQRQIGSLADAVKTGGDLFVLGRYFPSDTATIDKLNTEIRRSIVHRSNSKVLHG